MNIRTIQIKDLTSDQIAAWSAIQRDDSLWQSPFFRPEFAQAVATARNCGEVAVIEEDGGPIGFFPFERRAWNRALPIGNRLSDYHGIVASRSVDVNPIQLMRDCGLSTWTFDHLVSRHPSFNRFTFRYADSPCINLSNGYEAYESTLSSRFRSQFRRKYRKLEREVGPLRFDPDTRDPCVFSKLINWKIDQYRRTKTLNILGFTWVRNLLEHILENRGPEFTATMPALYAGDRLIAAAYLLRSGHVLHSWFSAYDCQLSAYSPGIHQKLKLLRAASETGITMLDLGKGTQEYKQTLCTHAIPVAEGVVDPVRLKAGVRSAWWKLRTGIRSSRLHGLMQAPVKKAFQLQGWLQLR